MLDAIGRGLRRPLDGARWVRARPELRRLVALPIALQALLLVAAVVLAIAVVGPWLVDVVPFPERADLLGAVIRVLACVWTPLAYVLSLFATGFVALTVGRFLAEPIYDELSQRVDAEAGGTAPPAPEGMVAILVDALRGLAHTLVGTALVAGLSCALLALNLIPVAGSVLELVLSAGSTAFLLAVEALDYPLSRRRFRYLDKLRWAWARRWQALGLGLAMTAGLLVPGAIVVVLPAAIVGATLWVVEEERAAVTSGGAPGAARPRSP